MLALLLADEALYRAKSKGRNRIEIMDDVEHRPAVTREFSKDVVADLRRNARGGRGADRIGPRPSI